MVKSNLLIKDRPSFFGIARLRVGIDHLKFGDSPLEHTEEKHQKVPNESLKSTNTKYGAYWTNKFRIYDPPLVWMWSIPIFLTIWLTDYGLSHVKMVWYVAQMVYPWDSPLYRYSSSSSSFRSSEGQIYITHEISCTLQVVLTAVEFLSYVNRGRPKLSSLGSQIPTILQDMLGSLWSISTRT